MSDTTSAANGKHAEHGADKYGTPPGDKYYRVIVVGIVDGGALRVEHREYLNRKVHDRSTSFKYLTVEAKKLDEKQSVGLVDESGKLVALMTGGKGRFASSDLRRLVTAKLTSEAKEAPIQQRLAARRQRQTQPAKADAPQREKRTSRGAKRTSRAPKAQARS